MISVGKNNMIIHSNTVCQATKVNRSTTGQNDTKEQLAIAFVTPFSECVCLFCEGYSGGYKYAFSQTHTDCCSERNCKISENINLYMPNMWVSHKLMHKSTRPSALYSLTVLCTTQHTHTPHSRANSGILPMSSLIGRIVFLQVCIEASAFSSTKTTHSSNAW